MSKNQDRKVVPGSDRTPLHGARAVGPVPGDERFEVTVRVRRRTPVQNLAPQALHADALPAQRRYMTREEYAKDHGADPADIAKVEKFAKDHGLVVVDASTDRRSVFLSGTAAQFVILRSWGVSVERFTRATLGVSVSTDVLIFAGPGVVFVVWALLGMPAADDSEHTWAFGLIALVLSVLTVVVVAAVGRSERFAASLGRFGQTCAEASPAQMTMRASAASARNRFFMITSSSASRRSATAARPQRRRMKRRWQASYRRMTATMRRSQDRCAAICRVSGSNPAGPSRTCFPA